MWYINCRYWIDLIYTNTYSEMEQKICPFQQKMNTNMRIGYTKSAKSVQPPTYFRWAIYKFAFSLFGITWTMRSTDKMSDISVKCRWFFYRISAGPLRRHRQIMLMKIEENMNFLDDKMTGILIDRIWPCLQVYIIIEDRGSTMIFIHINLILCLSIPTFTHWIEFFNSFHPK